MQNERRRHRVQQLPIVDPENHRPSVGVAAQAIDASAHQLQRVIRAHRLGQKPCERPQRNGRSAARRLNPCDHRTLAARRVARHTSQPRLPDARGRAHDNPAAIAPRPGVGDAGQLRVTGN